MKPSVAVYPGSFDPLTLGHEDIVARSLRVVDRLIIAVAEVSTQSKAGMFSVPERVDLIEEHYKDDERVETVSFSGLLVKFAKSRDARIIVRGLRAVSDFEYEFQMALMNRTLWPDVEVLFMAPSTRHSFLSSSLVREVARLGGEVSDFVNPVIREAMANAVERADE